LYIGEFKNDKLEGVGIVIFEEGNILISTFKNNKVEGDAYLYDNFTEKIMIY
jgi:antitoxin component YwqK of YwqJK toxin-antitoxin module